MRRGALVVVFLSVFADGALAEQGEITLRDGSVIRGDITDYEPESGVTVVMSDGQRLHFAADRIARVAIGAPPGAPAPAAVAAPNPLEQRRRRYQALPPPPDWLRTEAPAAAGRAPSLRGPLVAGLIGGLCAVVGGATLAVASGRPTGSIGAGVGAGFLAVGGGLVLINFAIVVPIRAGQRRRWFRREGFSARLPMVEPAWSQLFF